VDRRPHLEEDKEISQIQALLVDVAGRKQQLLDQIATAAEGGGEEGECPEGDRAGDGAQEDRDIGAVVAR
jgi:hypothetical protein